MNIYPDVPQRFFDVLNKYDFSEVFPDKINKLNLQLKNKLIDLGIPLKNQDWSWNRPMPTLRVSKDCPGSVIDTMNLFDWKNIDERTINGMASDADMYLNWILRIPKK